MWWLLIISALFPKIQLHFCLFLSKIIWLTWQALNFSPIFYPKVPSMLWFWRNQHKKCLAKNIDQNENILPKYLFENKTSWILHNPNFISLHGDIWNSQVKDTWQTFFRVMVRAMKRGYANYHIIAKNNLVLINEQKNLITEVIS